MEFSDLLIFKNAREIFARLQDAGMKPIITHPERNWLLQQRIGELETWVGDGCFIQITGQSLVGRFGKHAKKFSEELMRNGLVHFIASDAHDTEHRTPDLGLAHKLVTKNFGPEWAERLFITNPRCVLTGDRLDTESMEFAPKQRKWYRFGI